MLGSASRSAYAPCVLRVLSSWSQLDMTVPHLAGFINVVATPDSQTAQLRVLSGVVVTHIKLAVLCRSVRVLIPESRE